MPLTSIIIPTHDRPQLLRRAVDSARAAGTDIEVVVVDDGSTDETSSVCRSLEDIVYVRLDERRGVGFARERGILASSGELLSFLDDDDVRLAGSVDREAALLEATPGAALVYGQIYLGSQSLAIDGRVLPPSCPHGDVFWALLERNFIPSGTVVMRRSAVDEVGGLRHEFTPADDWDLWLRIAEHYPIAALAEPVAVYRQPTLWSRQGSSRLADALLAADLRVLERLAARPRVKADPRAFRTARRNLERTICDRLLAETVVAARYGDPYAFVSFGRAIVKTPGAFVRSILSAENWMKIRSTLPRGAAERTR